MKKPVKYDPAEAVNALLRLKANPYEGVRALATLRNSDSYPPGMHTPSFEFIEEHLAGAGPREREAAYLVATVFAHHPEISTAKYENLGTAARRLAARRGASVERTFIALLERRWESLPHYLSQFAKLLQSEGVPIPYYQLIRDLPWWENSRTITSPQVAWARQFYAPARKGEAA